MSTKRVIGLIGIIIIGAVAGFLFILYATVKTRSKNLSSYEPFSEWVGKSVTLKRSAVVFKEERYMNNNEHYPYVLSDSLHPQWQYVEECLSAPESLLQEVVQLPVGTTLTLEKAIQYTNGVSGTSYPTIFGTIVYQGTVYKVGYQWGTMDMTRYLDKAESCWHFHQAPWQVDQDSTFYALPTADLW